MKQRIWITIVLMSLAAPAAAQTRSRTAAPPDEGQPEIGRMASGEEKRQMLDKIVGEIRSRTAVEARITPGRPYSAEAITESTQVLADGNRIARKSVTRVYRDSEGRTRREQVNDSGVVESVSIVDPVAHTSFVLQPQTRTAYSEGGGMMGQRIKMETDKSRAELVERAKTERGRGEPDKQSEQFVALPRSVAPMAGGRGRIGGPGQTQREDLGTQNVEGVAATGTRTTTTIAAGAIGNLQPIKVVADQWFSPDLQVLVLTKHSDPRSGETTYRLVNIVRAEPDRSLFTVPPDFSIKGPGMRELARN
jgi:hypothetical protein